MAVQFQFLPRSQYSLDVFLRPFSLFKEHLRFDVPSESAAFQHVATADVETVIPPHLQIDLTRQPGTVPAQWGISRAAVKAPAVKQWPARRPSGFQTVPTQGASSAPAMPYGLRGPMQAIPEMPRRPTPRTDDAHDTPSPVLPRPRLEVVQEPVDVAGAASSRRTLDVIHPTPAVDTGGVTPMVLEPTADSSGGLVHVRAQCPF